MDALMPAPRAVIEVLDRDGQVRQSYTVSRWPVQVGRALGSDIVLGDPHVAAAHLRIEASDLGEAGVAGLRLVVGDTRNGVQLGALQLKAGEERPLPNDGPPLELTLGRTTLRLRLPGQTLEPEAMLEAAPPRRRHLLQTVFAGALLLAALLFNAWLDADPDGLVRTATSVAVGAVLVAAVWCGLWALLSKTFTRQGRFGWHLRVFLFGSLAWLVVTNLPNLLAFAFSWPWLGDFAFIAGYAVAGIAFYFHLLAVEPARPRLMRAVAAAGVVAGVAMTLWNNVQGSDRYGEELYMSHLFPPALRLAKPVEMDGFMNGVAELQIRLDKKAKEPASGNAEADDD